MLSTLRRCHEDQRKAPPSTLSVRNIHHARFQFLLNKNKEDIEETKQFMQNLAALQASCENNEEELDLLDFVLSTYYQGDASLISICCACKIQFPNELKHCGGCHFFYFCSVECQRQTWSKHKKNCVLFASILPQLLAERDRLNLEKENETETLNNHV